MRSRKPSFLPFRYGVLCARRSITMNFFGGWYIGRTVAACLLFGAATALQFQLPAMGINVPTAFLLMLPYLLALLAVAGVVGRLEPPTSLTLPFQRGK